MAFFPIRAQTDTWPEIARALQAELAGLFAIERMTPSRRGKIISFAGRLLYDSEHSYDEIARRFKSHGYTPLLRHERGEDVLVALPGLDENTGTGNPTTNILLLLATILTTLMAGALQLNINVPAILSSGSWPLIIEALLAGIPFAAPLLLILGVHELGHYFAARWHKVRATLPYFIPMPFGGIGTLGAFIALRSPMKDRKVLFDIGVSGPIAGFLVAVPVLIYGLLQSEVVIHAAPGLLSWETLGSSVLTSAIVSFFVDIPAGYTMALSPIFLAGWLGLLLTGLNLLPVGQLDGGHVAYALFGRHAHRMALLIFVGLVLAGIFVSPQWLIWALFITFGGLRHPPPLNDIVDLDGKRKLIGYLTILLFFLVVVPRPFG